MTGGTEPSAGLRLVKGAALGLTALAGSAVALRLLAVLDVRTLPVAAAGALAGYLAADLLSGCVHWFCDTFFDEDTPIVGRRVIGPFRHHHRDPLAITHYRLLEQDGTGAFVMLPPLALALASGAPGASSAPGIALHAGLCALAAGMVGANLFHKWAHMADPPAVVRWLQRRRLILSPAAHERHHRTHTRAYCVTSGWWNPLLDRLDLFGTIERTMRRIGFVMHVHTREGTFAERSVRSRPFRPARKTLRSAESGVE